MCIEKCKHGSGRGLHKPTLEIRKGGAFLLYYVGDGKIVEAVDEATGVVIQDYHNGGLVMIGRPDKKK